MSLRSAKNISSVSLNTLFCYSATPNIYTYIYIILYQSALSESHSLR